MNLAQSYVVFMDLGNSKLLLRLRFFIGDMKYCLSISSDLHFAIDAAFRANEYLDEMRLS
jgi:small-conductance mechanosensitive channel